MTRGAALQRMVSEGTGLGAFAGRGVNWGGALCGLCAGSAGPLGNGGAVMGRGPRGAVDAAPGEPVTGGALAWQTRDPVQETVHVCAAALAALILWFNRLFCLVMTLGCGWCLHAGAAAEQTWTVS